jgi:Undecaprenyl-phosphate glucose phosphotransferase
MTAPRANVGQSYLVYWNLRVVMSSQYSYTLISRPGYDRFERGWRAAAQELISAAIAIADIAVIVATAVATGIGYHQAVYGDSGDLVAFLQVGAITASIMVSANLFRGEYKLANFLLFRPHLRRSTQLWNVTFIGLLVVAFLTKVTVVYSRGWVILFYAIGIPLILLLRYLFVAVVTHGTRSGLISTKRVFLLGSAAAIEAFVGRYDPASLGVRIVGCRFLTPTANGLRPAARRAILDRDLKAAVLGARDVQPDAIFIIAPWSEADAIDRSVEAMLSLPAEIHLGPEDVLYRFHNVQLAKLGPMASLQLTRLPLSRLEIFQKRLFDLFASALLLVLLTPLLLLVAALIKLDSPGPIFFLQQRYGFNQKPFRIIKFRTMRTLDDGPVIRQATRDDPRVTRLGRWLRRWNVDEIPQLLNVLMGDMSLVGPRPHALSHNQAYEQTIASYARRHNVKPGITGWAQINGFRGETDTNDKMEKRVEHDLYYIDNWSLGFDLVILVRTALSPAAHRNAY